MRIFRKKHQIRETDAERDFRTILDIVKDYDKSGFNRLVNALEQAWKAYDIVLRTQTRQDKENQDLKQVEDVLDYEEAKNEK